MSLSKGVSRRGVLSLGLMAAAAVNLAGCGLTPLYGAGMEASRPTAFAYAEPNSRLEQIVYQELARSLGPNTPGAPLLSVSVGVGGIAGTRTANPGLKTNYQTLLTGNLTIVREGDKPSDKPLLLMNISRQASAAYTTAGQVLADNTAGIEAVDRAAKELAESLRLSILAYYSAHPEIR
jgi:LPS-assembly lipoprotein